MYPYTVTPTHVVVSCSPYPNSVLMANLSVFNSEPTTDYLELYDGPSTSSSQLLWSVDGSMLASQQFTFSTGASVRIPACIAPLSMVTGTIQYL